MAPKSEILCLAWLDPYQVCMRRCKAIQGDAAAGSPPWQLEILLFFLLPSPPSSLWQG